jgi:hypothetical protein
MKLEIFKVLKNNKIQIFIKIKIRIKKNHKIENHIL